jgi:hypothetical protein
LFDVHKDDQRKSAIAIILNYKRERELNLKQHLEKVENGTLGYPSEPITNYVWTYLRDIETMDELHEAEKDLDCKFPRCSFYLEWLLKIKNYKQFKLEWECGVAFGIDTLKWACKYCVPIEIIQWIIEHGGHICLINKPCKSGHHLHDDGMYAATCYSTPAVIEYFISLNCRPTDMLIRNIRYRKDFSFEVQKDLCNKLVKCGTTLTMLSELIEKYNSYEENEYFFNWAFENHYKVTDYDVANLCVNGMFQFVDKLTKRGFILSKGNHGLAYVIPHYLYKKGDALQPVELIKTSIYKLLSIGLKKTDPEFMENAIKRKSLELCKFLHELGFPSKPDDLLKLHLQPAYDTYEPDFVNEDYQIYRWLIDVLGAKLPQWFHIPLHLIEKTDGYLYNDQMRDEVMIHYNKDREDYEKKEMEDDKKYKAKQKNNSFYDYY